MRRLQLVLLAAAMVLVGCGSSVVPQDGDSSANGNDAADSGDATSSGGDSAIDRNTGDGSSQDDVQFALDSTIAYERCAPGAPRQILGGTIQDGTYALGGVIVYDSTFCSQVAGIEWEIRLVISGGGTHIAIDSQESGQSPSHSEFSLATMGTGYMMTSPAETTAGGYTAVTGQLRIYGGWGTLVGDQRFAEAAFEFNQQ